MAAVLFSSVNLALPNLGLWAGGREGCEGIPQELSHGLGNCLCSAPAMLSARSKVVLNEVVGTRYKAGLIPSG